MEETENCTSPSTEDEDDIVENEIWCLQRVGKETDWLHLLETEVTVGRGMDVTHRLLSLSCPLMISRKHCIFKQTASGQWTVTDNMSVNGVMVNKERIPAGAPHILDEGDTISIGLPVNSAPVEYEYKLTRRHEQEVKGFLARPLGPGVYSKNLAKHKMAKRKRSTTDDADVCPSTSPSSKSKAQRKCASPNSHHHQQQHRQHHRSPSHSPTRQHPPTLPPPPEPPALSERTQGLSTASQEAGPSDPITTNNNNTITSVQRSKRTTPTASAPVEDCASGASDSESTEQQELGSLQDYSQNMLALREQVQNTQRQVAALEGQLHGGGGSGGGQEEPMGLRARLEALRGELRSHQKQALSRMKSLEKTYCDEERRLEMEKSQQKEEGIRKQLEQALQEHRKVIEELKNSCQGFEEILQAKDKELEEEKEKAKAQKAEVVTQMTEVLESELQCIICSELFIEAVTLNCAHSFCLHCIRAWRQRKDECPICRQAIRSEARSLVLDNCIDRMVEQLSTDMKERRLILITERKAQAPASPPRSSKKPRMTSGGVHILTSEDDSDVDDDSDDDDDDSSSIISLRSDTHFHYLSAGGSSDSILSSSTSSSAPSLIFSQDSSDEDEDEDEEGVELF